mmetsp:Transcript_46432/g.110643  ORF Transcript_46432/g.110643 Transcript_46432/m.110643 type:complete len:266 (+) Transcript_46432:721-1518(+)
MQLHDKAGSGGQVARDGDFLANLHTGKDVHDSVEATHLWNVDGFGQCSHSVIVAQHSLKGKLLQGVAVVLGVEILMHSGTIHRHVHSQLVRSEPCGQLNEFGSLCTMHASARLHEAWPLRSQDDLTVRRAVLQIQSIQAFPHVADELRLLFACGFDQPRVLIGNSFGLGILGLLVDPYPRNHMLALVRNRIDNVLWTIKVLLHQELVVQLTIHVDLAAMERMGESDVLVTVAPIHAISATRHGRLNNHRPLTPVLPPRQDLINVT